MGSYSRLKPLFLLFGALFINSAALAEPAQPTPAEALKKTVAEGSTPAALGKLYMALPKDTTPEQMAELRKLVLKAKLDASATTQSADDVASELVQIVAQTVADRATESAWSIMRDRLSEDLRCSEQVQPATPSANNASPPAIQFPNLCKALKARIEDVIAQPNQLLEAAIQDLATVASGELQLQKIQLSSPKLSTGTLVSELPANWRRGSASSAFTLIWRPLRRDLLQTASQTCGQLQTVEPEYRPSLQSLWIVGECIAKNESNRLKDVFTNCDIDAAMGPDVCNVSDADKPLVRQLSEELLGAANDSASATTRAKYGIGYVFDSAQHINDVKADDKRKPIIKALLNGLDDALSGAIDQDWAKVATGSVAVLESIAELHAEDPEKAKGKKFYQLVAAIGAYAATYSDPSKKDSDAAHAARKEVIDSLARSLVSRSTRSGGGVFSVGGTFGIGGAYRHAINDKTKGGFGPFALPLGVGFDTYPEDLKSAVGFHLQLSFLDLGQYVKFEGGKAQVDKPRLEDAFAVGIGAGPWFGSREVPIWVGPYGGISPFGRTDGKPSWFAGGLIGGYVPLIDLN